MPEIKLSKVELAALDLLIAELQEAKVRGPLPPTVIVTRVLTTLTRTLTRNDDPALGANPCRNVHRLVGSNGYGRPGPRLKFRHVGLRIRFDSMREECNALTMLA